MRSYSTCRPCSCGSGLFDSEEWDARGIYLCRACESCRQERLSGFRPEVLSDPAYHADEDIEPDYGPCEPADDEGGGE